MAEARLYAKTYSDVAYVEGMYRRDPVMERALHKHCKQYFDENYRGVFFVGDEHKMEIFQESFITLWEKIEKRKIYVEDGILKGKDGAPFIGKLTTYFMGIAKLKFKEWVRDRHTGQDAENEEKKRKAKDAEIYKEKSLDDIMLELPTFKSKNALKTEKYKCMENLRKSAQEIYHRYMNA